MFASFYLSSILLSQLVIKVKSGGLECFPGDINIAIFAPVKMDCSSQSTKYYLRYRAIHQKMVNINKDRRLIFARNNITLGYVLTESCWKVPEAAKRASQIYPSWKKPKHNETFCQVVDPIMKSNVYYVSGVVGSDASATSEVLSYIFQNIKMWQISTTATSDLLFDRVKHPFLYKMVPPDSYQGKVVVDILVHFNWSYVIVLFDDNSYGRNLLKSLYKAVSDMSHPICVALEAPLQGYETNYIKTLAKQILNYRKAKVVIQFGVWESSLLQLLRGSGVIFLSSDWNSGFPSDLDNDFYGSLLINIPFISVNGVIEDYNMLTYDIISNGSSVDKRYWEQLNDCCFQPNDTVCPDCSTFKTIKTHLTGDYITTFHKTLDSVDIFVQTITKILESQCNSELVHDRSNIHRCLTSELIGMELRTSEFNVSSGPVRFDDKGTIIPFYDIKQHITGSNKKDALKRHVITVGNWTIERGLQLDISMLIWNKEANNSNIPESKCSEPCSIGTVKVEITACCWECRNCRDNEKVENSSKCLACPLYTWPETDTRQSCIAITHNFVDFDSVQYITMSCISSSGVLLTLVLMVFYFIYREHKLLKASALMLSAICLTGLLVAFACLLFFGGRPNLVICTVRNFLYHLSLSASYSSLLVKTNRIYRVFAASRKGTMRPKYVSTKWVLVFTITLISIQIVILTFASIAFPMHTTTRMSNPYLPNVEASCPSSSTLAFWLPFGYNLLLIFGCSLLAFATRSLPDNFHDAKCIFASGAANCFLWTAFVPSLTSSSSGAAEDLLVSLALVVSSSVLLCTVFLPKVYGVIFAQNAQINFYNTTTNTVGPG